MKNLKKIADDLHHTLKDPDFESFIAEQILSTKGAHENEPCFSISHQDMILDIWKEGQNYSLVKSVLPCAHKKAGKDFKKIMKKKELVEEIKKIVESLLD